MNRAVFFDRDGVVNPPPPGGYVLRADGFHLTPGIPEVLRLCRTRGFLLILVTSQQGVGKGLMSLADLQAIHDVMQTDLSRSGAAFDDILFCPHLDGTCSCRKPSPALIFQAAERHRIDVPASILVGDQDRDIRMARHAGIGTTIRVLSHPEDPRNVPADHTVRQIPELLTTLSAVLVPFDPPAPSPTMCP